MYLSSRIHPVPGAAAAPAQPAPQRAQQPVQQPAPSAAPQPYVACTVERCHKVGPDFGPEPFVTNIDEATTDNPYFRRTLWTGEHLQLTLMCIAPGGEVGLELHPDTDQFFRVEQGQGRAMMGSQMNDLSFQQNANQDDAIFIPANTWHNVVNTGSAPLKLYSIYAPTHHPKGTIHCTKADSDEAED